MARKKWKEKYPDYPEVARFIRSLAREVKEEIRAQDLTVAGVAEGAGVTPETIYNLINERVCPRLITIVGVLDVLGLELTLNAKKVLFRLVTDTRMTRKAA